MNSKVSLVYAARLHLKIQNPSYSPKLCLWCMFVAILPKNPGAYHLPPPVSSIVLGTPLCVSSGCPGRESCHVIMALLSLLWLEVLWLEPLT